MSIDDPVPSTHNDVDPGIAADDLLSEVLTYRARLQKAAHNAIDAGNYDLAETIFSALKTLPELIDSVKELAVLWQAVGARWHTIQQLSLDIPAEVLEEDEGSQF